MKMLLGFSMVGLTLLSYFLMIPVENAEQEGFDAYEYIHQASDYYVDIQDAVAYVDSDDYEWTYGEIFEDNNVFDNSTFDVYHNVGSNGGLDSWTTDKITFEASSVGVRGIYFYNSMCGNCFQLGHTYYVSVEIETDYNFTASRIGFDTNYTVFAKSDTNTYSITKKYTSEVAWIFYLGYYGTIPNTWTYDNLYFIDLEAFETPPSESNLNTLLAFYLSALENGEQVLQTPEWTTQPTDEALALGKDIWFAYQDIDNLFNIFQNGVTENVANTVGSWYDGLMCSLGNEAFCLG